MFTTFPAHKKRPAAGAGTHCRVRCRGKAPLQCPPDTAYPAAVPDYYTSLWGACPYKYQFFHLLSGFCTDFDSLFGQFLVCFCSKSDKKAAGPGGLAALKRQKIQSALAELFPVRQMCSGCFGLSVFQRQ